MIGPLGIPDAYEAWNRTWHAPHGRPIAAPFRRIPDVADWKTRYQGPFAFQPNNNTRRFEYPWAYDAVPLRHGMTVVEIGGGVSGFQVTLARGGAAVTNVDPFLDYGSTADYGAIDPAAVIDRFNRVYRTTVRLMRCDLPGADLPSASVDVAYCISALEHFSAEARADTLCEASRILRPGGKLVLTVDLFLDLVPFTSQTTNRYGTNVDISEIVELSKMTLVTGRRDELLGFAEFDADRIQSNLSRYLVGGYPAMTQCLVLARP